MRAVSQRGQQLLWSVFTRVRCLAQLTFGGSFSAVMLKLILLIMSLASTAVESCDENFGVRSSLAEGSFPSQNLDVWALVCLFV